MPRRLPPLNALRAFEAAARLGSFTTAAGELHVTSAAVSQHVKGLERYLGVTLFERRPAGLLLTDLGRTLLPELTSGFDRLAAASERARQGELAGPLTVTTLPAFATGWLLPRWPDFERAHPRIELVLRTDAALLDFRRQQVDMAIRFGPTPPPGLRSVVLLHEDVFPVASPALVERLARKRGTRTQVPRDVAGLAGWPLLHDIDGGPAQPWLSWDAWFERAGSHAHGNNTGMHFSDSSVLRDAAVQGLGVALGRAPHIGGQLARGELLRLTDAHWRAGWHYRLAAPAAHWQRPRVRAFAAWLRERAATGQDGNDDGAMT
jgi:LysR family glycine cleavage system transcriptional activator